MSSSDDKKIKRRAEAKRLDLIVDAARFLKWNIAFPEPDESDEVPGFIVGEPRYVKELTEQLPEKFIIFEPETLH